MAERKAYSKDTILHMFDLVGPDMTIRNTTFNGCQICGPAVLFLEDVVLDGVAISSGDVDSFLLKVDRISNGMIVLIDCTLNDCTYTNVTLAGTPDQIAVLREHFY